MNDSGTETDAAEDSGQQAPEGQHLSAPVVRTYVDRSLWPTL